MPTWILIVLLVSLAIIVFGFWQVWRMPQGKQEIAKLRREVVTLRTVRTSLVLVGALMAMTMTLVLATVANDGSVALWVLVAAFLIVDIVFLVALAKRWHHRRA